MKQRLTFGIGTNDAGYPIGNCPFYRTWKNMLKRCYHSPSPTYVGCTVHQDWLTFSRFRAWMALQDWHDKCLDKDLLLPGNKVYSPSTCCFISQRVNKFMHEKSAGNGLPLGVSVDTGTGKYRAQGRDLEGKQTYLGLHISANDAHQAYMTHKRSIAHTLALSECDPLVKDALINRYNPCQGEPF